MELSRITASFTKRVSDGNYGAEEATAFGEVILEGDAPLVLEHAFATLNTRLRAAVHSQLDQSPSPGVRHALIPVNPLRTGQELRTTYLSF